MSKSTLPSKQQAAVRDNAEASHDGIVEDSKTIEGARRETDPLTSDSICSSVMQLSNATDLRPSTPASSRLALVRKQPYTLSVLDKKAKHSQGLNSTPVNSFPKAPRNKMSVRNLISDVEPEVTSHVLSMRCSSRGGEKVCRPLAVTSSTSNSHISSSFAPISTEFEPKLGITPRQITQTFLPEPKPPIGGLSRNRDLSGHKFPPLPAFTSAFAISRGVRRQVPDVQTPNLIRQSYANYVSQKTRTADYESNGSVREHTEAPGSAHKAQFQPLINEPKAKRPWTEQEDSLLRSLVEQLGQGLWAAIAAQIPGRSGKQVRERWLNHLSPNVTKRPWSTEEDEIIIESHKQFGNCWSRIAKLLDGRSDNSVKNRFYTTLRRRIAMPRSTGKRGSPGFSQGPLPNKKRKTSPTLQQPSEQVEIVNRGYNQGRMWE